MKAVVVGYGSIGQRHARVLGKMGLDVAVVSRRALSDVACHRGIAQAMEAKPEYVVIANETAAHHQAIEELAACGFDGIVLVEKPLFDDVHDIPANRFRAMYVGYNLRFHPVIQHLKKAVGDRTMISILAYVGQYLPNWRPNSDYASTSSSKRASGGGVLRDLSHEIDFLRWIAGPWRRLAAIGGRYSSLDIDVEDSCSVLAEHERCSAVMLQMNYLDRAGRRFIVVNHDGGTHHADVFAGVVDGKQFTVARDDTYIAQHRAVLAGDTANLCDAEGGLEVVRAVKAIERAMASSQWVSA